MNRVYRPKLTRFVAVLALTGLTAVLPGSAVAGPVTAYNVNQAFIDNELSGTPVNPNSPYTYGYTLDPSDTSAMSTAGLSHTTAFAGYNGLQGYYVNNNAIVPAIIGNVTNAAITTGFATVQSGQLLLHPGGLTNDAFSPPLAFADLRYTVSTAGAFNINGIFSALDKGGTDVHVYVNGVSAFNGAVSGVGATAGFNFVTSSLAVGDKIDFIVGPGGNGIGNDSTGLYANIAAVPEPSTLALAGVAGLIGLGYGRRRQAKAVPSTN